MIEKNIEPQSPTASGSQTVSRTEHIAIGTVSSPSFADAEESTGELTFITDEGECITFPGSELPLVEATTLAAEEALGKIWNRPSE